MFENIKKNFVLYKKEILTGLIEGAFIGATIVLIGGTIYWLGRNDGLNTPRPMTLGNFKGSTEVHTLANTMLKDGALIWADGFPVEGAPEFAQAASEAVRKAVEANPELWAKSYTPVVTNIPMP